MQYTNDTKVFVLTETSGLMLLATATPLAYAFTSEQKATDFVRVMREHGAIQSTNRFLPCTLAEWFEWQTTRKFPDLAIDPDAQKLLSYSMLITADPATQNVECLTVQRPQGTVYQVRIQPRKNGSSAQ